MAQDVEHLTLRRSLIPVLTLMLLVLLGAGCSEGPSGPDGHANTTTPSEFPTSTEDEGEASEPPGSPEPTQPGVSPAPSETVGSPEPTGTVVPTGPESLESFQENCERGAGRWRRGQVDYPDRISVELGKGETYNAAVDVRETPLPPDDVVENTGASTFEVVAVQCLLAARLVPVDEGITVGPSGEEDWIYRQFTPDGVVEWAWSVEATTPEAHKLRLDLRPAVRMDGLPNLLETQVSSFSTEVAVTATGIEEASYWFSTQWPLLAGIAAILAAAVLAVAAFGRKLLGPDRFDRIFGRWFARIGGRRSAPDPTPAAEQTPDNLA